MDRMNGRKGYSNRSAKRLILPFINDSLLILVAFFLGGYLRFGGDYDYAIPAEYSFWKMIVFVPLIQIPFYYFDLYEMKVFRAGIKMAVLLLESLGISFLLLSIVYYLIPALAVGRGILALSLILFGPLAFLWRLLYRRISRNTAKERILILGTGKLAKEITKEVYENGQDNLEIIGLVDE